MAGTASFPPTTPLGPPGEHCAACGAPLAADQRYCLNCGVRRADSRVPFPQSLQGGGAGGASGGSPGAGTPAGAEAGPVVVPVGAAGAPAKPKRSWADRDLLLPVLGTSLLAIAVGILIGRSGASDTINTRAPVVNVAPTAGAGAAPTDTTANASADTAAGGKDKGAGGGKAGKTTTEKAAPPANVSKSVLQDNANSSGKDYVNKSKKLPTEVSTGGTPPAKDNKAPGGGAEAQTIG